ncbi:hypothetical protein BZA70DRAFT_309118 [Myxozyma melibiosi]|uniref:Uncharacterized protein n=1 Tax=Myxozyma melibiosi TaxID=54550 RepID=A0ABR1FEV5_9ASCO
MALAKPPPQLDLQHEVVLAVSADEARFAREDVKRLLKQRTNCTLSEYMYYDCALPSKIEDEAKCRPIVRYFAVCRDRRSKQVAAEITNEQSLDLAEVKLPPVPAAASNTSFPFKNS